MNEDEDNTFHSCLLYEAVYTNIQEFSDVIIKCGDTKFECHKVFLASRSRVFREMFNADVTEKIEETDEVQIDDIKPDVMGEMLYYIYMGKTYDMENDADFAKDVFIAAVKYQIESLKKLCEEAVINSIWHGNFFSLLIMGDEHSNNIKQAALEFMVKNRRKIDLKQIKELEEHPSLMMELVKEFTQEIRCGCHHEYEDIISYSDY